MQKIVVVCLVMALLLSGCSVVNETQADHAMSVNSIAVLPTATMTPSPTPIPTPTPSPTPYIGMSVNDLRTLPGVREGEKADSLRSEGTYAGLKTENIYAITDEKLALFQISFPDIAGMNSIDAAKAFDALTNELSCDYGTPARWAIDWFDNNDQFKMDMAQGIANGKAIYRSLYYDDEQCIAFVFSVTPFTDDQTTATIGIIPINLPIVESLDSKLSWNHAMTAMELYQVYDSNPIAADLRYKGHRIKVSGKISSIDIDVLGTPYVVIGTDRYGLEGVQCYFNDPNKSSLHAMTYGSTGIEAVATLKKGQEVEIIGTCDGMSLLHISLETCELFTGG